MNGILVLAVLLGPYAWGVRRARSAWPLARTACAVAGAVLVAASVSGPLDAAADRSLTAHMAQHLVVATVAPLLVALGAPMRLAFAALPPARGKALTRTLRRPALARLTALPVAILLPAVALVLVHLTGLFSLALAHPVVHAAEHAVLFWTALVGWIVVLGVDPVPSRPGAVGTFVAASAWMIASAAVGATWVSAARPLWAAYAARPDALTDQQDAGTLMWLGGVAVLEPLTLWLCMRALILEERRQQRREALEARLP
jgi:putative membrane protein